MKRRVFSSLCIALSLGLLITSVAYAATYEFYFPTTVTDNTSAARTNYPIMLGMNGQTFIDSGKINPDGLNTNIQIGTTDVQYMMSTTNMSAVVPTLPASGSVNFNFYTGYSPEQTGFPIVIGDSGNVTVNDAVNLEPSANFSISVSGHFDTDNGTDKDIVIKSGALRFFVSPTVSGNITAGRFLVDQFANSDCELDSDWLTGAGATSRESGQKHGGSYAWYVNGSGSWAYQDLTWYAGYQGESVTITVWVYSAAASSARIAIDDGDGFSYSANHTGSSSFEQLSVTRTISGSATRLRLRFEVNTASVAYFDDVVFSMASGGLISSPVTLTGVSSGNHTVRYWGDVANFHISLDGVESDNTTAVAITNNALEWVLFRNTVMPYTDNITMSVNGTQQLFFAPNTMIQGNVLPDRQGGDNDGTINWGTNNQINLHYGEMVGSASTEATTSVPGGFTMPSAGIPANWFNDSADLTGLPFYNTFNNTATETGIPVVMIYFWISIALAWAAFIAVTVQSKSAAMGALVMIIVMVIASMQGVMPGWIVFATVVMDLLIIFLYRQVSY